MDRLALSTVKTMKHLQAVKKWVKQRAKTRRSLNMVRVDEIGKLKREKVEEILGRLRKAGAMDVAVLE
jgi:predicted transcriptional regulator of viral defense system